MTLTITYYLPVIGTATTRRYELFASTQEVELRPLAGIRIQYDAEQFVVEEEKQRLVRITKNDISFSDGVTFTEITPQCREKLRSFFQFCSLRLYESMEMQFVKWRLFAKDGREHFFPSENSFTVIDSFLVENRDGKVVISDPKKNTFEFPTQQCSFEANGIRLAFADRRVLLLHGEDLLRLEPLCL